MRILRNEGVNYHSRMNSKYFLQVKRKKIDDYTYEDKVVEISFKGFLNYILYKLKLI